MTLREVFQHNVTGVVAKVGGGMRQIFSSAFKTVKTKA